ncbi:hypothetical protein [Synechococcus sp. 8F6]|uniref:hypothetical protein n=1 Tax=Synechococcus sp. 8F6 TaxID=2025606 RepID=UPI0018EA2799
MFGSVLRPDYQPGLTDLDFLVDFQPMPPVRKAHAFSACVMRFTICLVLRWTW